MNVPPDHKKDPARRCLKVEEWPLADQEAWQASLREGDVLTPGGLASTFAPMTRTKVVESYGRYVNSVGRRGKLDPDAPLIERVTPELVRPYIAELQRLNAPKTVWARILGLYQAVRCMAPDHDWRWLLVAVRNLHRVARPAREKRPRLVPIGELLALGMLRMDEAEACAALSSLEVGVRFRDGLYVGLLAARPIRRSNFCMIEIGRHLVRQGEVYWLRFEPAETKNGEHIDHPIPALLTPYLDRYLSIHRPRMIAQWQVKPRLQPPAGMALWVSEIGTAVGPWAIYMRIAKMTREAYGHVVNPHLFRDCAATSTATLDPEHVGILKSVLTHKWHAIAERYYNHAQGLHALDDHQAGVLKVRRGSAAAAKASGPAGKARGRAAGSGKP